MGDYCTVHLFGTVSSVLQIVSFSDSKHVMMRQAGLLLLTDAKSSFIWKIDETISNKCKNFCDLALTGVYKVLGYYLGTRPMSGLAR